jgi:uncharacterized membrane protein YqaE (UPF0057 family)
MTFSPGASLELEYSRSVGAAVSDAFVRKLPMAADVIRTLGKILPPPLGIVLGIGLGGRSWLHIPLELLGDLRGIGPAVWIIARR